MHSGGPVSLLSRAGSAALDIVYPRCCEGCGSRMEGPNYLCWECLMRADKISRPFCELCGDPVDGRVDGFYTCGWCERKRPQFDKARSVFRYKGPVMRAVQQFKYHGGIHLVRGLAEIMAASVKSFYSDVRFDLVIGVPLFARKERERGYNQAALLADAVATKIGCDSFNRAVVRTKDTRSQTELKASERNTNLKGAFEVRHPRWVRERHILLVDDVITTGATIAAVSRSIKKAGAASVNVISIARG